MEDVNNKTELIEKDSKFEFKELFEMSFWRKNPYWIVRAIFWIFYSVWLIVMIVGGFIAWLISIIFV